MLDFHAFGRADDRREEFFGATCLCSGVELKKSASGGKHFLGGGDFSRDSLGTDSPGKSRLKNLVIYNSRVTVADAELILRTPVVRGAFVPQSVSSAMNL